MLTDEKIIDYSYEVSNRFEKINVMYIKKISSQINEIGRLSAANLNRLEQLAKMNANIAEINSMIAKETNLSLQELFKVYDDSGFRLYTQAEKLYKANGKKQPPLEENLWLQNYLESTKQITANTFVNLSKTTSIQNNYKKMIDLAIDTAASGLGDYNAVIRKNIQLMQGIRVRYESGLTRRLDSAVRMNVLEGIRTLNNDIRARTGKEFGADGVEISAHALCATDHINVQGKQYSNEDFERLQLSLKRAISTCNCKHVTFPIILGVSEPTYTAAELKEFKNNSNKEIEINGKKYTKYEASQAMRNIETKVRYAKEKYIIGESLNDEILKAEASDKIKALNVTYRNIAKKAGLEQKRDRMYVPGYNGRQNETKNINVKREKPLTGSGNSGIINYDKVNDIFDYNNSNINSKITPQEIFNDLFTSNIGKEMLEYIECLPEKPKLDYFSTPQGIRGEEKNGVITIYVNNCKDIKTASCAVIHECTHRKYGIGQSQWAESQCVAAELLHRRNRNYLTFSEKRMIIKAVKDVYPEYNWRKGGIVHGRRK